MRIPFVGEILALGLLLGVAAGCGNSSDAGSGGATSAATPAAQTATPAEEENEASETGDPDENE